MSILDYIMQFVPTMIATVVFVVLFIGIRFILKRQGKGKNDWAIIQQLILLLIIGVGLIVIVLTLPINDTLRGQITQLMGIVISAVIALSSATLFGNMLAGILLRIINSYKPGDFIEIDNYFGRVSERGLFHTELQTVDSDLITLPNLFLATNAVKVKRLSKTYISSEISLGYDVSRNKIETCLLEAAKKAGLEDGYVTINSLNDFSVVYQIHGKLGDVKQIISKRSLLRAKMLDELHEQGIEIVSPTFMNQRQVGDSVFIPRKDRLESKDSQVTAKVEEKIFDKAEKAESIEKRKQRVNDLEKQLDDLNVALKSCEDEEEKAALKEKIEKLKEFKDKMIDYIEKAKDRME